MLMKILLDKKNNKLFYIYNKEWQKNVVQKVQNLLENAQDNGDQ
jgi:hypothetical protein